MSKNELADAVARLVKSKGYISSNWAFKNGYDQNFRHKNNPKDHLRAKHERCDCKYVDDTSSAATCQCIVSFDKHEDNYFPSGPFDFDGAIGHVGYDIIPYLKGKR